MGLEFISCPTQATQCGQHVSSCPETYLTQVLQNRCIFWDRVKTYIFPNMFHLWGKSGGIILRFVCQNMFRSHWYQPRNKQTKYLSNTPENVPSWEASMFSEFNGAQIFNHLFTVSATMNPILSQQLLPPSYQRKNIHCILRLLIAVH